MTISTSSVRNDYANTSGGSTFPYTFKIFAATDIQVYTKDASGTELLKTLTTDYSVTGAGSDSGGNVTFVSPVAAGTEVHIVAVLDRNSSGVGIALTQTTDLVNETGFFQDRIEDRFDILCRQTQVIANETARSIKITNAATLSNYNLDLPSPKAGYIVGSTDGVSYDNIETVSVSDAIAGNWTVNRFVVGVGFTAGVSTSVTLSKAPASSESILVFFDGVAQHRVGYNVVGTTLNFTSTIPGGVSAIEVRIPTTLAAGTVSSENVQQAIINVEGRVGVQVRAGQQADVDGAGRGGLALGAGVADRGVGAWVSVDGHGNWVSVASAKGGNPTEFIVYSSATTGYAQTVPGTGRIVWVWGSKFDAAWVGRTIYFLRKKFEVSVFESATSVLVTEVGGSTVTFPGSEIEAFNFCYTSGTGTCQVVGTAVTWLSGDPFVPLFFRDFTLKINGAAVTVASFNNVTSYTLSAPLSNGVFVFEYSGDIFDQLATLRVQGIAGTEEENVNLYAIAGQEFYGRYYALRAGGAGSYSKARPLFLGSGDYGPYLPQDQVGIMPAFGSERQGGGYVSLGGINGLEAMRVYCPTSNGVNLPSTSRNRVEVISTPSGFNPAFRAAGSDANVGLGLDVKGTGEVVISQDFSRTVCKLRSASNTNSFVVIDAGVGSASLGVESSLADADLKLVAKGTGLVSFGTWASNGDAAVNGFIMIKDAAGNVRKVPTIS